jgi:hypothetical protein
MKRVIAALLAGIAVAAAGHSASAADLAVPAAAPAAAVVPVWTGFYIGVNGGAAGQHSSDWTFEDRSGFFSRPGRP